MESIASGMPSFGNLTNIDPEKPRLGDTPYDNSSLIARDTFAQIIEGVPIRTPFSDEIKNSRRSFSKTIIVRDNAKPSREAVQKFDEIKTAFAPQNLVIDLKVRSLSILILYPFSTDLAQLAQRYQDAPQGWQALYTHPRMRI